MPMPPKTVMQKAISIRDRVFDGRFYYAVITTGIFCKPSCPSKAANAENLLYFPSVTDAMQAGFRPCQRCTPTDSTASKPDRLIRIARYIEEHAEKPLNLATLAQVANLNASRLQRVFKEAFGLSPKVYHDAIRMRLFKHSLKNGESVTDAIFSSGFGSISRVYGERQRSIGMTPKAYRAGGKGEIISYACRNTVMGTVLMAATDTGVCFVQFGDSESELYKTLQSEFPKAKLMPSPAETSPELDNWIEALNRHISNGAPRPDLPLDIRGTSFQMLVWKFLLSVKEGDVISYGELAAKIGKPKAVRAAASACARNIIGILIPCHRVLRGDGSLGGYRWGEERKRALLDKERARKEQ